MQHFQSVLIVVGVLAIASVLVHGYMLSRKEKAAALESESEVDKIIESSDKNLEIDNGQSGLSINNQNVEDDEDYIDFSDALADEKDVASLNDGKTKEAVKDNNLDDFFSSETVKDNISSFSFNKNKKKKKKNKKSGANDVVKTATEQVDIATTAEQENITEQLAENIEVIEEPTELKVEQASEAKKQQDTEFFIIHVMTKDGNTIGGLQLLQFFLTSGFRHGDMSLFHRHLESDGTGPILFSIANTLAPGTFDSHEMGKFSTEGVSFFINAPKPDVDMKAAFDMMFRAVGQLADEFDCEILNEDRKPFSEQDFRAYEERLIRYL
ncbi:MAG: cell division protein ZipA [Psychromonas sp.]